MFCMSLKSCSPVKRGFLLQARARELTLLSERDAIKATAARQAKLLEIISAPDGKISALKSEVARAESAASKLRLEMDALQSSLEQEVCPPVHAYRMSKFSLSHLSTLLFIHDRCLTLL